MKIILRSGNMNFLVHQITDEEMEQLSESSMIEFMGRWFMYNGLQLGDLVFGEVNKPLNVDHWLES